MAVTYEIYKTINGEKSLVATVTDITTYKFRTTDVGEVTYSVVKVDDRGSSEEVFSKTINILARPQAPKIIEKGKESFLQFYPEENNILVQKSYDKTNWETIFTGQQNDLILHKENTITYYRYRIYNESAKSTFSDIIVYDQQSLDPVSNLTATQTGQTEFSLQWDELDCESIEVSVGTQTYQLDGSATALSFSIDSEVTNALVTAYSGLRTSTNSILLNTQSEPNMPELRLFRVIDKTLCLDWYKLPYHTYSLSIDGNEVYNGDDLDGVFEYELDSYGSHNFSLTATNYAGTSEAVTREFICLEQPNTFEIENLVDSDNKAYVGLIINNEIANSGLEVELHGKHRTNHKFRRLMNVTHKWATDQFIPKHLLRKYNTLVYRTNTSKSNPSEIVQYTRPRPVQETLQYVYYEDVKFKKKQFFFAWTNTEPNMCYSLIKNGHIMKRFSADEYYHYMTCLPNDMITIISHIGYEKTISNTIHIGCDNIDEDGNRPGEQITLPIYINYNFVSIIGKQVALNVINSKLLPIYDYEIRFCTENDEAIAITEANETNLIIYNESDYGSSYKKLVLENISTYLQYTETDLFEVYILSKPTISYDDSGYRQIVLTVESDERKEKNQLFYQLNNKFVALSDYIDDEYIVKYEDYGEINPLIFKAKTLILSTDFRYESEESDEYEYVRPDIDFTCTVTQVNKLPEYSNEFEFIITPVEDKVFPEYFDVIITDEDGTETEHLCLTATQTDDGNYKLNLDFGRIYWSIKSIVGWVGITKYEYELNYKIYQIPVEPPYELLADYYYFKLKKPKYKLTTNYDYFKLKKPEYSIAADYCYSEEY